MRYFTVPYTAAERPRKMAFYQHLFHYAVIGQFVFFRVAIEFSFNPMGKFFTFQTGGKYLAFAEQICDTGIVRNSRVLYLSK